MKKSKTLILLIIAILILVIAYLAVNFFGFGMMRTNQRTAEEDAFIKNYEIKNPNIKVLYAPNEGKSKFQKVKLVAGLRGEIDSIYFDSEFQRATCDSFFIEFNKVYAYKNIADSLALNFQIIKMSIDTTLYYKFTY